MIASLALLGNTNFLPYANFFAVYKPSHEWHAVCCQAYTPSLGKVAFYYV